MKTSSILFGVLSVLAVGPVSGQSFEAQAAREINNMSVETGQVRGAWSLRLPGGVNARQDANRERCRGYYSGLVGRMAGIHIDMAVERCVDWLEGRSPADSTGRRVASASPAVAPAKEFGSLFKCENRPALSIELKNDGTVTVNGDNLVPDGADHPYAGLSYNCFFADANTFKIRVFGKLGSIDVDSDMTMTLVDGGRNLRVSKADKSSKDGRRIGENENYACSRAFFQRW